MGRGIIHFVRDTRTAPGWAGFPGQGSIALTPAALNDADKKVLWCLVVIPGPRNAPGDGLSISSVTSEPPRFCGSLEWVKKLPRALGMQDCPGEVALLEFGRPYLQGFFSQGLI